MQQLTSVSGSFAARLLAARLRAEGLDPELRGVLDGPYGLTVGDLARVDVFVPDDQLDDARLVMLAADVDAVFEPKPIRAAGRLRWPTWIIVTMIVAAVLAPLARYFVS